MRKSKSSPFAERERDAFLMATASDNEIFDLCRSLGDDPEDVAERMQSLLIGTLHHTPPVSVMPKPALSRLPLPDPGLLPLHRILVVDDNVERLATRIEEFRLHEFKLGFVIETAANGQQALQRLQTEAFDAVLIELESPSVEERQLLRELRSWSTPLAPILLKSEGMEFLELRTLNRDAVRALAVGFGKHAPPPYRRKGPTRVNARKSRQDALFDDPGGKKTGSG